MAPQQNAEAHMPPGLGRKRGRRGNRLHMTDMSFTLKNGKNALYFHADNRRAVNFFLKWLDVYLFCLRVYDSL